MITIHSKYFSVSDWLKSPCFLLKPACVDNVLKAFADINTIDVTDNDIDCKGDARRVGLCRVRGNSVQCADGIAAFTGRITGAIC